MHNIPFLKPSVPVLGEYISYLKEIDERKRYSNFGPVVTEFESKLLHDYCGGGFGVTVNNATIGLMLAIKTIKRPEGTIAILPSFTFAATAQAAKWCGLEVYYVDVDPDSWAISEIAIQKAVTDLGDKIAVIIPYATFGIALHLDFYQELISQGYPVVVDAAPGFGSRYDNGTPFGVNFSGLIVYSFHATKPFGVGEGGFVYSSDSSLITQVKLGSNFGFTSPGVCESVGLNAKMSEIAAAVGLAVLEGYPRKINNLENIYTVYLQNIKAQKLIELGCSLQSYDGMSVHQFFPMLLPKEADKLSVIQKLLQFGIEVRSYFDPACDRQRCLESSFSTQLNTTRDLEKRVICLPLWEGLTDKEVTYIISTLHSILVDA